MKRILLSLALIMLPACANPGAFTEQLADISVGLDNTSLRLDSISEKIEESGGDPVLVESFRVATEGITAAVEGVEDVAEKWTEAMADAGTNRERVGKGLEFAGGMLGPGWGDLLKLAGAFVVGGGAVGAHARGVRKQVEASHNHAAKKTMEDAVAAAVKLVNGNKT